MAWYRSGTISLTNGSATITGSGTAFIANASIGEGLIGPDGRTYEITNIASDTSLTISPAYLGSTAGGQAYAIAPLRGRIADLIAETSSLLASFATVRDGIGEGLFPDGSAAEPAFRFINDQDTGFYRFGTNAIGLATAGSLRALFDASGNVGIGTSTPRGNLSVASAVTSETTVSIHLGYAPVDFYGFRLANTNAAASTGAGLFRIQRGTGSAWVDAVVVNDLGYLTPGADNSQTLGEAAKRWSVIYAGTGTINTSDEREKTWRGALTADELRAAKRIIAELGIYQWNDAIAEKGAGNARLHFGVRAQQVFEIMEDEGLDWTRYAWCCYDEWAGGDRYGIRPDQLAFWLIAAQADIQADLETRLAALEAA